MTFALDDYVEVADRIAEFYRRFPEGRLYAKQLKNDKESVEFIGYAKRSADDHDPATGHSELAKPGTTPYTRGSEVENCETSAIGRAIVMAGIPSKKVASADEVRAKVVPMKAVPPPAAAKPTPAARPAIVNIEEVAEGARPQYAEPGPPPPPPPAEEEAYWAAVVAAVPQRLPHDGWKAGEVHEAGHRPLRSRANGSLYCPTRLDDGRLCPWRTSEHPK